MKHTNRQTETRTLTDLYRALDRQHAVTITYLDQDGTESIRTIEISDIRTTKSGRIEIRAMCRLRGEARGFLLHRIASYTCHRIPYVLEQPEATTPAGRVIVVRSERQLIARELGRDYLPRTSVTRTDTALAA
ncbi:WYL domain-containing protein [Streptomyces sp. NRRL F-5135]|uniref:WYL domain-containing protein n=1 Tax=Streptomyces sp. NRRL F-5135 TaxID=1463858 RepID=UPI0004C90786|nr:WYL domain-containing protein [Streptomyces sp. NRRL F-5135]